MLTHHLERCKVVRELGERCATSCLPRCLSMWLDPRMLRAWTPRLRERLVEPSSVDWLFTTSQFESLERNISWSTQIFQTLKGNSDKSGDVTTAPLLSPNLGNL